MSNRLVRQIDPRPRDEVVTPKFVSEYSKASNIVLVGDPGSGKSFLFDALAQQESTKVQSARAFLNTPAHLAGDFLFIDALDERRAGRTDQATIDLIVQRLFEINPSRVRLACRAHDWLGGTDLAAFHPYFAQSGGHFVLALESLTPTEQENILRGCGVTQPKQFIREAEQRGLSDFLDNPQNLIMLAEAVQKKAWPTSRLELFEETTVLLLKEHNKNRTDSGGGQFTVKEVRAPASAASALRLISDVEGISLSGAETSELYPSYRTIPFAKPELVLASLERRTFRSIGSNIVDYSHRVRAEYAAAGWLADKIRNGLPLSRVQALVGIDGIPAPELRGVHAWLAVLLPEFSETVIDADPLGILIYSDPSSLSLSQRERLLKALTKLAAADPFFKPEKLAISAASAMCKPDMTPALKLALKDTTAPFGIKQFILELLCVAPPRVNLQQEILKVIAEQSQPFGLKAPALRAAARLGPNAAKSIVKIYYQLGESAEDIRLKGFILSTFYVGNFSAKDVSDLYGAVLKCDDKLLSGVLWQVSNSIPTDDLTRVFDAIENRHDSQSELGSKENHYEIEHFIERLLTRSIHEKVENISGAQLWSWLNLQFNIHGDHSSLSSSAIRQQLKNRPDLAKEVFEAAIDMYSGKTPAWRLSTGLREAMPLSLSAEPLRWLNDKISLGVEDPVKLAALYDLALSWTFAGDDNVDIFESLYLLGETNNHLTPIRDRLLSSEVRSWQADDKLIATRATEKRVAGRRRNLQQFESEISSIRNGNSSNWVVWLADLYFANFNDVDGSASPRERILNELGTDNVSAALDGLKAHLRSENIPSLKEVTEAREKNSYPRLWYALLAGMDELWIERSNLDGFSDEELKALVAIDLELPTSSRSKDGVETIDARAWKGHLLATKTSLVKDAYLFLAEAGLTARSQFVHGFYELMNDEAFAKFRGGIAVHLLESYPELLPERLEELLKVALAESPRPKLADLIQRYSGQDNLPDAQRQLWAIAAYLLEPNEATESSLRRISSPSIVWQMRALTSYDREGKNKLGIAIRPIQRELFARIAAGYFPSASHPTGGWSGDENPWDASEYIRLLLDALSVERDDQATSALERLLEAEEMKTYVGSVRHALANQRARNREMNYKQPNWTEAISTLTGGPPANVADLHAILVENLKEISVRIGTQNIDVYKGFWNEDSYGRPTNPKIEESARDVLLGLLKPRLDPLNVITEPEGHMAADKRADITAALPGKKISIELKRDIHPELWTAPATQLDRFYARDHEASGYGIYGVFWYGSSRSRRLPKHPDESPAPKSSTELEVMLNEIIAAQKRYKLRAVVIDVSISDGRKFSGKNSKAKIKKTKATKTKVKKSNAVASNKTKPRKKLQKL